MKSFPKGGLIGKTVHLLSEIQQLKIPLRAAYASYFIVLSVFPALLLVLACLQFTAFRVTDLLSLMDAVLPEALLDLAQDMISSAERNSTGALVGISVLTTLWSASAGVYGILLGLDAAYDVAEDRGYFYTRGVSILYSLALLLLVLLTLVLHVFGNAIMSLLQGIDNPVLIFVLDILDLRYLFLMIIQVLLFALLFTVLPNKRNSFLSSLPGAVFTAVGWSVFSALYSVYVTMFSRYTRVYGSLYGFAVFMLWLYFCLSMLFYGGALNRYLMERKQEKT